MNDVFTLMLPDALVLLEQMVSMESPTAEKRLTDKFVLFLAEKFMDIGGTVDLIPAERVGNHLRVTFGSSGPDNLLLLGHTDTVWPEGEIIKRPFRIENGRATGPGVFDMKAGIVLIWMALRATAPGNVTVLLTSDEEAGSTWSRSLIEAEARRCRAVLVMEPSLPGGALKTARKGVGGFTVKAIGRAAHAGIDPERGINAIEELARQILKLQNMSDPERGTTVTVGVVNGGSRVNVVAAEASADVDVRVTTSDEAVRITEAIRSLSAELPGARLEIRGGFNRPPMEPTAGNIRLFEQARTVAARLGITLAEGATGGASDGNFTSALGVPTLDGLGAIGGSAHGNDEWVEIGSLPMRAALIAGLIDTL
jgi:glutamate carboxypeptidase